MKIVFVPLQEYAVHMFDSHGIEIFLVPNSQAESREQDIMLLMCCIVVVCQYRNRYF